MKASPSPWGRVTIDFGDLGCCRTEDPLGGMMLRLMRRSQTYQPDDDRGGISTAGLDDDLFGANGIEITNTLPTELLGGCSIPLPCCGPGSGHVTSPQEPMGQSLNITRHINAGIAEFLRI